MEYHGFLDDLKETTKNYSGKHVEVVKYLPSLFNLLCDILYDSRSGWNTKLMVSSALGYFVLPEDAIPDSDEEFGYIDDLYLVVSILGEISLSLDRDLIEENWKEDENILSIIERVHQKTQDILGDVCEDILGMVGLRKYISMEYENLGLNHSSKIRKLMDEKIELVGLLSFITAKLYGSSRSRSLDNLREFLQKHEDYPEIERIIQIARDKSISETINKLPKDALSIERKMRRKRIMKLAGE
jgi:uncharacterized membrane protein YkvA (DUF1232 family)